MTCPTSTMSGRGQKLLSQLGCDHTWGDVAEDCDGISSDSFQTTRETLAGVPNQLALRLRDKAAETYCAVSQRGGARAVSPFAWESRSR
jgi:hypothetical protein